MSQKKYLPRKNIAKKNDCKPPLSFIQKQLKAHRKRLAKIFPCLACRKHHKKNKAQPTVKGQHIPLTFYHSRA